MSSRPNPMFLRPAEPVDVDQILALNAESVSQTSPLNAEQFRRLSDVASFVTVAEIEDRAVAFLIAIPEDVDYDNKNYRWFSERLRRFLYVDRIVVSSTHRGSGIGNALYDDVQSRAEDANLLSIAAEIDLDPPNTGSLNFHRKHGFVQIGKRTLHNGKIVSMQLRSL